MAQQHLKGMAASAGCAQCLSATFLAAPQRCCPELAAGRAWLVLGCVSMIQSPGWGSSVEPAAIHAAVESCSFCFHTLQGAVCAPTFACSQCCVASGPALLVQAASGPGARTGAETRQAGQQPYEGRSLSWHPKLCGWTHSSSSGSRSHTQDLTNSPRAALGQLLALSWMIACCCCS